MKDIFLCYVVSVGMLMLVTAGCDRSTETPPSAAALSWSQLARSDFLLSSYNGTAFWSNKPPTLSFHSNNKVSGSICNRFTGLGHFENNQLTITPLLLINVSCADPELDALESAFRTAITKGVRITLENDELHLQGDELDLVYMRKWPRPAQP
ncbi:META domain-containing protein [Nitratidesulfovibrio termitidis]|uniref:META domain-containing protein n=1 Tax=Nitratidesulfovibrio termitidis TaxID=42252 RepID=UPI00054D5C15|nr:META domain-containing protein [Nitratidesulfovibrio termitidis]